jgi:DnaJ-class molecular chaperone
MINASTVKNAYQVLGLALYTKIEGSILSDAYHKCLRQYPPETHPEEFILCRSAYETLKDPEKRAEYELFHQPPFTWKMAINGFLEEILSSQPLSIEDIQTYLQES